VALEPLGFIDLPAHAGAGGFDHAAVHGPTGRVYVAHTANDAVDVIDVAARKCVASIPGLTAVAGALVDDGSGLVFTSNRGENTVGILSVAGPPAVERVAVGIRPNGLAHDPRRGRLLVAHVGDPGIARSCTVSVVDVASRRRIADLPVAGRTRWAVFDPGTDAFFVNVADPPQVVVVDAARPAIRAIVPVPHAGPHGLDLDVAGRRLFCACDAGVLVELDADTGAVRSSAPIAGVPDVVFFDPARQWLYVAIGDPGVVEVLDTTSLRRHQIVATEPGAHTLAFDPARGLVCAFLPMTHRAMLLTGRTDG
jgi:DNA-binding beta-propeller fold protein YncE